jgi:hypothetical protein
MEEHDSNADDLLKLGGSIELSGFNAVDRGSMVVLKKIIGNYARRMSDSSKGFQALKLRVKIVHDSVYELHCQMIDSGNAVTSSVEDRNVFVAVDSALKKIIEQIKG